MLLQYHTRMRNIHDEYIQILARCITQPNPTISEPTISEPTISEPTISEPVDCGEELAKQHIQEEIISQMSDQDLIWERIRKAQVCNDDTKQPLSRPNNLINSVPNPPQSTQQKYVEVNKLHQFPRKKQGKIIKNIFDKAVINIERLHEISPIPDDERDNMIQKEADNLLSQYLKKNKN